jgi:hypothetical protein
MTETPNSLEDLLRPSSHALVVGVGGGGDVVGALAAARFLEFLGLSFTLGGLSWERILYDPVPGPRTLAEVRNVRVIHPFAWMAGGASQTSTGVPFAEARMAEAIGREVLLIDINGGVSGVVDATTAAMEQIQADLLVGIDVGGDSLARGGEPGLRSPLADAVMLAAFAQLERRGRQVLWGVFGYGSDGELSADEIEIALSGLAAAGGLLGAWGLTPKIAAELDDIVKRVPTEASAVPLECFRGGWGRRSIRGGRRSVKLTPLATLIFLMSAMKLFDALARPARALEHSRSLEEANRALHDLGLYTELDFERDYGTTAETR